MQPVYLFLSPALRSYTRSYQEEDCRSMVLLVIYSDLSPHSEFLYTWCECPWTSFNLETCPVMLLLFNFNLSMFLLSLFTHAEAAVFHGHTLNFCTFWSRIYTTDDILKTKRLDIFFQGCSTTPEFCKMLWMLGLVFVFHLKV